MDLEERAAIVDWIGRLGAAGVKHVRARFTPVCTYRWAHIQLWELAQAGMLVQHRILYHRPALYVATRKGLRWRGRLMLLPLGETAEIVRRERAATGDDADEGEER